MIEINHLHYAYPGARPLFEGLNAEFRAGELTLLMGNNGAGKSTLLKLVCAVLQPSMGSIHIQGREHQKESLGLFSNIFYAPQNIADMCVGISPAMDMQVWKYALPQVLTDAKLIDLSTTFGEIWDNPYHRLSQGEARQCALSILPFLHERFWVLDEPLTGLDDKAAAVILKSLREHIELGQGALIVTHDPKPYQSMNPRQVELSSGVLHDV